MPGSLSLRMWIKAPSRLWWRFLPRQSSRGGFMAQALAWWARAWARVILRTPGLRVMRSLLTTSGAGAVGTSSEGGPSSPGIVTNGGAKAASAALPSSVGVNGFLAIPHLPSLGCHLRTQSGGYLLRCFCPRAMSAFVSILPTMFSIPICHLPRSSRQPRSSFMDS